MYSQQRLEQSHRAGFILIVFSSRKAIYINSNYYKNI